MKTALIAVAALTLVGCADNRLWRQEPITVTIIEVQQEGDWGCIGTDKRTIVKGDDGRVDDICGKWGEVGEKITGCWHSGHREAINDSVLANGFRRDICPT